MMHSGLRASLVGAQYSLMRWWLRESAPHGALAIRHAIGMLGCMQYGAHSEAELILHKHSRSAIPALEIAARSCAPPDRAVHAAVMLHRMKQRDGAGILCRLAHDPEIRNSDAAEVLRGALHEIGAPDHYLAQASSSLIVLEQMRDSFRNISRFRQALEVLRFLDVSVSVDFARRGLALRAVGGENLDLVRLALREHDIASLEHICLARKEVALTLIHGRNRPRAHDLFQHALRYPNPAVRLTALFGISRLCDARSVPEVRAIALSPDDPLALDARHVLDMLPRKQPDSTILLRAATSPSVSAQMLRHASRPGDDPASLLRIR